MLENNYLVESGTNKILDKGIQIPTSGNLFDFSGPQFPNL